MHAEEGEYQVQLNTEDVVVTCMKREGQGVEARAPLSLFLAVMVRFLQSISMSAISDVSTVHIFSLDF